MIISRTAVCGLLLGLLLLWLPSSTGAQGPMISVLGCRADAEELARKAEDSSIDDKVFNDELAKFQKKCITREAGSMRSIARNREQFKVQQAELRGSHGHVKKTGTQYEKQQKTEKDEKNFESQSSTYDPGGMPGRH